MLPSGLPGIALPGLLWPGAGSNATIPATTPGLVTFTEVPGNCYAGNVEQWTLQFTDLLGNAQDPTTVEFKYSINRAFNTEATLVWSGATSPQAGTIARTGVGKYVVQVDTTALAGVWTFEGLCPDGLGQCLTAGTLTVYPTTLT